MRPAGEWTCDKDMLVSDHCAHGGSAGNFPPMPVFMTDEKNGLETAALVHFPASPDVLVVRQRRIEFGA